MKQGSTFRGGSHILIHAASFLPMDLNVVTPTLSMCNEMAVRKLMHKIE